ncbi:hypothetical protein OFN55_35505, partial [Escherichia coli]|nr:hypothetical protein [Escherichia coli]
HSALIFVNYKYDLATALAYDFLRASLDPMKRGHQPEVVGSLVMLQNDSHYEINLLFRIQFDRLLNKHALSNLLRNALLCEAERPA